MLLPFFAIAITSFTCNDVSSFFQEKDCCTIDKSSVVSAPALCMADFDMNSVVKVSSFAGDSLVEGSAFSIGKDSSGSYLATTAHEVSTLQTPPTIIGDVSVLHGAIASDALIRNIPDRAKNSNDFSDLNSLLYGDSDSFYQDGATYQAFIGRETGRLSIFRSGTTRDSDNDNVVFMASVHLYDFKSSNSDIQYNKETKHLYVITENGPSEEGVQIIDCSELYSGKLTKVGNFRDEKLDAGGVLRWRINKAHNLKVYNNKLLVFDAGSKNAYIDPKFAPPASNQSVGAYSSLYPVANGASNVYGGTLVYNIEDPVNPVYEGTLGTFTIELVGDGLDGVKTKKYTAVDGNFDISEHLGLSEPFYGFKGSSFARTYVHDADFIEYPVDGPVEMFRNRTLVFCAERFEWNDERARDLGYAAHLMHPYAPSFMVYDLNTREFLALAANPSMYSKKYVYGSIHDLMVDPTSSVVIVHDEYPNYHNSFSGYAGWKGEDMPKMYGHLVERQQLHMISLDASNLQMVGTTQTPTFGYSKPLEFGFEGEKLGFQMQSSRSFLTASNAYTHDIIMSPSGYLFVPVMGSHAYILDFTGSDKLAPVEVGYVDLFGALGLEEKRYMYSAPHLDAYSLWSLSWVEESQHLMLGGSMGFAVYKFDTGASHSPIESYYDNFKYISNSDITVTTKDGSIHKAKLLITDPSADLAILHVSGAISPLTLGDNLEASAGNVLAIPSMNGQVSTGGIVSASLASDVTSTKSGIQLHLPIELGGSGVDYSSQGVSYQTPLPKLTHEKLAVSAALMSGASGAPIIHQNGKVIGIVSELPTVDSTGTALGTSSKLLSRLHALLAGAEVDGDKRYPSRNNDGYTGTFEGQEFKAFAAYGMDGGYYPLYATKAEADRANRALGGNGGSHAMGPGGKELNAANNMTGAYVTMDMPMAWASSYTGVYWMPNVVTRALEGHHYHGNFPNVALSNNVLGLNLELVTSHMAASLGMSKVQGYKIKDADGCASVSQNSRFNSGAVNSFFADKNVDGKILTHVNGVSVGHGRSVSTALYQLGSESVTITVKTPGPEPMVSEELVVPPVARSARHLENFPLQCL